MSGSVRIRDYLKPLLGEATELHAKALMDLLENNDIKGDDPLGLVAMGHELLPVPEIARRLSMSTNMLRFLLRPPGPMRRHVRYARVDGKIVHSMDDAALAIEEQRPLIATLEAAKAAKERAVEEARAAKKVKEERAVSAKGVVGGPVVVPRRARTA